LKILRLSIAAVLLSSFLVTSAGADWRSYVWTYEYQTVEKGEAEFESYFTISAPDIDSLEDNTVVEHRMELEVGMNERFDIGLYQMFEQAFGQSLRYTGFKVRGRYRFGEKGRYVVDPLLYLEYKGKPDLSEHGIEVKFILARDFGPNNISFNPILEVESNGETETELEYAAGISRRIGRLMKIGVEAKGGEKGNYIGPVISHGTEHLWVTLGSAFGLGDIDEGAPEFEVRMLLGVGL
jgi:hypothetical protein